MKDFDKPYRLAIFTALTGISAPVYDEVKKVGDNDSLFVLLGGQRSKPDPRADHLWARRLSIELIITQKTGAAVSKDDIDDLANEILLTIFPDYDIDGISAPGNFQFADLDYETGTTTRLLLSPTESVVAKTLIISCTVIQQV